MRLIKRLYGPERRMSLWVLGVVFYISGQALLYGQVPTAQTPETQQQWEHLTLEGALVLAVAVQYRENRAKELVARQIASESATAIAKATALMGDVTSALEKLSNKIAACPAKSRD